MRTPSCLIRRRAWPLTAIVVAIVMAAGLFALRGGVSRRADAAKLSKVKAKGPNILIILGDDHAADTLGCYGDPHGATPRIDGLAKQGVSFRRAYCNAPVCTASRQSLITGKLPHAVGVTRLQTPLPATAVTLGDWLGDRGYLTAAYGKMHFNSQLKHGFKDRIDTSDWETHRRANPSRPKDHVVPWRPFKDPVTVWLNADVNSYGLLDASMEATYFTKKAVEFFDQHRSDPFLMVLGYNEPHSPFKFPDDCLHRFKPEEFQARPVSEADRRAMPKVFRGITPEQTQGIEAAYYTSISYLDSKVGQVLDALDASGMAENTIVVYLGDNGYLRGHHGRFEKHCFYEQAVRVPLIIRWPKHLAAGTQIDELIEHVDLLPSLLELVGISPPPDIQGHSFAALAQGIPGEGGRRYVFSEYLENEEAMLCDRRFKLIIGSGRRRRREGFVTDDPTPGPYEHLYDRETDPNEDADLAERPAFAEKKRELTDALFERITKTRNTNDQPPADLDQLETIRWCLVPKD